jgi:hypothetical protein
VRVDRAFLDLAAQVARFLVTGLEAHQQNGARHVEQRRQSIDHLAEPVGETVSVCF